MAQAFMVEIDLPQNLPEEFVKIIPENRQLVNQFMAEGRISIYTLAEDRSNLWIVVYGQTEDDVRELLDELPIMVYLQPNIRPLAFHMTTDHIMTISLN